MSGLKKKKTWVGTSCYMSPERVSGLNYSFNADIWGVGILAFECCAGRGPYQAHISFFFFLFGSSFFFNAGHGPYRAHVSVFPPPFFSNGDIGALGYWLLCAALGVDSTWHSNL